MSIGQAHTFNHYQGVVPLTPVPLPHRIGRVPVLAPHFQRRDLPELPPSAHGGPPMILAGTAGTGKSQLAAQHAEEAWERGDLQLLLWIADATRESVLAGYTQAAQDLLGRAFFDPAEGAQAFLNWLRPAGGTTPRPWLIVLDGVTDPAELGDELWPPASPAGQVLVTSRRRDFPQAVNPVIVPVRSYTRKEAVAYLQRALDLGEAAGVADRGPAALVDRVGPLPESLAQAVRHIDAEGIDVLTYVGRLDDRTTDVSHRDAPWWLSIEAANGIDPVGVAYPVLLLACTLAAQGVPQQVLSSAPALELLQELREGHPAAPRTGWLLTAAEVGRAVRVLHDLSLLDIHQQAGHAVVRVEPPVRATVRPRRDEVFRARLGVESLPDPEGRLALGAAEALQAAWPEVEADAVLAGLLLESARALSRGAGLAMLGHDGIHEVGFRAGRSAGEWGRYEEAELFLRELAEDAAADFGDPENYDVLQVRSCAAGWHGAAGDDEGAAAELAELYEAQTRLFGPSDRSSLSTRHRLAWLRLSARDWSAPGPRADLAAVLRERTRVLGPDAPDTVATLFAVVEALVVQEAGTVDGPDVEAALDRLFGSGHDESVDWVSLTTALVAEMARVLGPEHPDTLRATRLLATTQMFARDSEAALDTVTTAVAAARRALGPDHPVTLGLRQQTALVQDDRGLSDVAVAGLTSLLADQERLLGPDHPDTLDTRCRLLAIRPDPTDTAKADQVIQDYDILLADTRRVFGPDHRRSLALLDALARCQAEAGRKVAAVVTLAELAARCARVLGADHPKTLVARGMLAWRQGEAGDPVGAVVALASVLTEQTRVVGPEHADTFFTRHNLAWYRAEAGDLAGALADFRRLLPDRERAAGAADDDIEVTRIALAYWERKAGRPKPG
ncbi:tetratricopeptide repeat protein [Streptomyces sp. NPDC049040]|uniref:tetratricopeptide repeat protein n=1 Tax=Streptomyces sp. NPDC049040 TaxID=3365593 RepID=UPI00371AF1DA